MQEQGPGRWEWARVDSVNSAALELDAFPGDVTFGGVAAESLEQRSFRGLGG